MSTQNVTDDVPLSEIAAAALHDFAFLVAYNVLDEGVPEGDAAALRGIAATLTRSADLYDAAEAGALDRATLNAIGTELAKYHADAKETASWEWASVKKARAGDPRYAMPGQDSESVAAEIVAYATDGDAAGSGELLRAIAAE